MPGGTHCDRPASHREYLKGTNQQNGHARSNCIRSGAVTKVGTASRGDSQPQLQALGGPAAGGLCQRPMTTESQQAGSYPPRHSGSPLPVLLQGKTAIEQAAFPYWTSLQLLVLCDLCPPWDCVLEWDGGITMLPTTVASL